MPFLQAFITLGGSFLWSCLTSRLGQIAMASAVAWLWSGWRTDDYWKSVIASEKAAAEAAYQVEVSRQEKAAVEIAAAATARAEDDIAVERELRAQIDALDDQEKKNVSPPRTLKQIIFRERAAAPATRPCVIDSDFSNILRRFDATATKAKPSRRAK